jgi:hypothetical protein
LDLFTLRHRVCSFFCFGSLAVDPVGGALNYVIALLLPPNVESSKMLCSLRFLRVASFDIFSPHS